MGIEILEGIKYTEEEDSVKKESIETLTSTFNIPFQLENIDFNKLVEMSNKIKKVTIPTDIHYNPNQLLMTVFGEYDSNPNLFITTQNHTIPLMSNLYQDIIVKTCTSEGQRYPKGFMLTQFHLNNSTNTMYSLNCYIPFSEGKKLIWLSAKHSSYSEYDKFFYKIQTKHDEDMINVPVPTEQEFRDISNRGDSLSDNDKIVIANCSSRFSKKVDEWSTVYEATQAIKTQLNRTVDPNYMNKLLDLLVYLHIKEVSTPTEVPVEVQEITLSKV